MRKKYIENVYIYILKLGENRRLIFSILKFAQFGCYDVTEAGHRPSFNIM